MKKLLGVLLVFILVIGCTKDNKADETSTAKIPSITIGTQIWTTKNLDVATYSDGTPIPPVTDPTLWKNLTTGTWCYYNNDATLGTTYGKLYNWYAVAGIWNEASKTDASQRKKLSPTGYHIPSNIEWTTLITYLGGNSVAGGKMKATTIWDSPNTEGTNISGFAGLPGGIIYNFGAFVGIGNRAIWWSLSGGEWTDGIAKDNASCIYLDSGFGGTYIEGWYKTNGFSVRCLKD